MKLRILLPFISAVALLFLLTWQRRRFPAPIEKALDRLRVWWLGVAKKIGHVQSVILLTVFYFTGIAAGALIARLKGEDFLCLDCDACWRPRKKKADTIETLKRQF